LHGWKNPHEATCTEHALARSPNMLPMRPRMLTIQPVPAPRPPPRKSIPLHSADLEVIVAANDTAPTEPILRALSAQHATAIVDRTEEEVRARVEAEIIAIVRKALGTMMPPPRTDHGASVRWLVV